MQVFLLAGDVLRHGTMKLLIRTSLEEKTVEVLPGALLHVGAPADDLPIDGVTETIATFQVDALGAHLTGHALLTVDDIWVPREVPRLLLPGERVRLGPDLTLSIVSEPPGPALETAAMLRSFLSESLPPHPSPLPSLICLTGLDAGRVHPLGMKTCELGRGMDMGIRIRDRAVSRIHARLSQHEGGYLLEDIGSPNGTFINGLRVRGATPLPPRCVLEMGHSLLRFDAGFPEPIAAAVLPVDLSSLEGHPLCPESVAPEIHRVELFEDFSNETLATSETSQDNWILMAGAALALLGAGVSAAFLGH